LGEAERLEAALDGDADAHTDRARGAEALGLLLERVARQLGQCSM
jgi:hypothetical protein